MTTPTTQARVTDTVDPFVGRAVDLLKSLDEIDCGDYSRECYRCGGAGTVDSVQYGMPGQDWCPICGGTGFTWDADQQRREKLEIIAASLTPNARYESRLIHDHRLKVPGEEKEFRMIKETHREFIVALFKACGYRTYLELGIGTGKLVRMMVEAGADVTWVDRDENVGPIEYDVVGYVVSTDRFFGIVDGCAMWDLIFIDADHDVDQVYTDLDNACGHLAIGGTIILHDTDPARAEWLAPDKCGTAWKVLYQLQYWHEFDAVTLPVGDAGLTIVRRRQDRRALGFVGEFACLNDV